MIHVATIEEQATHVGKMLGEAYVMCYRLTRCQKAQREELADKIKDVQTTFAGLLVRLGYESDYDRIVRKSEVTT